MQQEVRHRCGREWMGRNRVAVGEVWRTVTQGNPYLATLGWRRHKPKTSLMHAVWVCLHAISSRRSKWFSFATRFLNGTRRLPPSPPDAASSRSWRRDFQCPRIAFNVPPMLAPALHLLRSSWQSSRLALNPCKQTVQGCPFAGFSLKPSTFFDFERISRLVRFVCLFAVQRVRFLLSNLATQRAAMIKSK